VVVFRSSLSYMLVIVIQENMQNISQDVQISPIKVRITIYTTINFTDEFRTVSVTLRVGADWLARRDWRGQHTLSILIMMVG